mgnify:CR=1 FL=1
MVEVKALDGGRFEVYAEDLHHEIFEGRLGAQLAAMALASELAVASAQSVSITAPWGLRTISPQPVPPLR